MTIDNGSGVDRDVDANLDPATTNTTCATCSEPSNGVLVNNGDGTFDYTPNADVTGTDSFGYELCDTEGACDTAVVTITVTPVNDPPVAMDDSATTDEDMAVTVTVLVNDMDIDGTVAAGTVRIGVGPSHGSVGVNGDDTVTYTPNANFNGVDTFAYTVEDNDAAVSNEATVTISITAVNDPPVATDDSATTPEDTPATVVVLANDTDIDGTLTPGTVAIGTGPSNGAVAVNGDGTVTYTPNADFNGVDTFTYTVADDDGATSNFATVTMTIPDVNDPPVATDDSATTQEDTPVTIPVVGNDTDSDGAVDPMSIVIVAPPGNGAVVVNSDGTATYTPAADFNGVDTFTYTVADDDGATSNVATVTVTVDAVNDPPVANNDSVTTPEETPVTIPAVANDTDSDGTVDVATVAVAVAPANGTVTVNPDGTVNYTPNTEFNGTDTFTYTVQDNGGAVSNVATVTVVVGPVNDPPVAVDDGATTSEDTPVTIPVTTNDTDVDGAVALATVALVAPPSNGAVVVNGDGTGTYTPNADFSGMDTWTYTVADDLGALSNVATVTVIVDAINDPPVARDDHTTTPESTLVTIDVVANDTDIDSTIAPATVGVMDNPTHGAVAVNSDGAVDYTPEAGFRGTDTFTYTVQDNDGLLSNVATVTVIVPNAPPVAEVDSATTPVDTPVAIPVLVNDADPNADLLTVTALTALPANGTVTFTPPGAVMYMPNAGFTGPDTFTYEIRDGQGGSATASVTVTIRAGLPLAVADQAATPIDTPVMIPVLNNDADANDDPLTITTASTPANGTVTVTADGTVAYTPAVGFTGIDTFTYAIADPDGNADTAIVTVLVNNTAPTATSDGAEAGRAMPVTIAVLANDSDSNSDPLTILDVTDGANGMVLLDDNGTPDTPSDDVVVYQPNPDFTGLDTFTYAIADATGNRALAAVTVQVNAPPVADDDSVATAEETLITIAVVANDTDSDGMVDLGSVTVVANPAPGTAIVTADGAVAYTPNVNFTGTDTLTYTVQDNDGALSNEATVTVVVEPVNDPPVAVDDSATTPEDTPVTISLTANDTDSDGMVDPATVTAGTNPANGTIVVHADGTVTYTPHAELSGADTFTYTVRDDAGAFSNVATVTVTVEPVNDPPVALDDSATTPAATVVTLDIVANDTDLDGTVASATAILLSVPAHGTVVNHGDGTVAYTPDAGFSGVDTFTYMVEDNEGATSNVATVTVTVGNAPPIAVDDLATTVTDLPVAVTVLANDRDPNGDPLTIDVFDTASTNDGVVALDDSATPDDPTDDVLVYTSAPGFAGEDMFPYTITDGQGGASTATVTVTVASVPPLAADDSATTPFATAVALPVLVNDADSNGEPLRIDSVTPPLAGAGTVTFTLAGEVIYTPAPDFIGITTFTYTIRAGQGGTATATVTVTVGAPATLDLPPTAVADYSTTPQAVPVTIDVLPNDQQFPDGT